ncbi:MAG: 6-carboxytetrahydropterin synthase QueD [Candidatus Omnitrophica bacterium]|nr:6-carboxytetrahydropterin synthase QueD [Candidatus Omnitrophota bacterium]MCM8823771.1 6-carboxytetrahydropterin synthase QueD [Candidatus Omnitrophota bacterium]MCM8826261.1 6-carboxytetrahydropterin synthase QueD [Candidatus Omnitrophota bacterium]
MFEIRVNTNFSAAHYLNNYKGKCENLHGHNWKVEVVVCSSKLDRLGMVMDFGDLKKILNEVVSELDHKFLNEIKFFKYKNTTSEYIAKIVFQEVGKKLLKFKGSLIRLKEVSVWEQDNSCATYRKIKRE